MQTMTEREIDRQFEQAAGELEKHKKRRVFVPKTGNGGEEMLELGLNGRMFLIRRGEWVELYEPLIEVLKHAGTVDANA